MKALKLLAAFAICAALTGGLAPPSFANGWHGGGPGGWGCYHGWGGWGGYRGGWGWGGGFRGGGFRVGVGFAPYAPYYYAPRVYYAPPVYYAAPAYPALPPGYYAPYPGTIPRIPAAASRRAAYASGGPAQSCNAGNYTCPMEATVPVGGRCYCPANDGSRAYGTAQ